MPNFSSACASAATNAIASKSMAITAGNRFAIEKLKAALLAARDLHASGSAV